MMDWDESADGSGSLCDKSIISLVDLPSPTWSEVWNDTWCPVEWWPLAFEVELSWIGEIYWFREVEFGWTSMPSVDELSNLVGVFVD